MLLQNFVEEASVAALAFTSMSKHDNMAKEKTNTRQVMHAARIQPEKSLKAQQHWMYFLSTIDKPCCIIFKRQVLTVTQKITRIENS